MKKRWTAEDQAVAEVAAACGVSRNKISQVLGMAPETVKYHLVMGVAERKLRQNHEWRKLNHAFMLQYHRKYWKEKPDAHREYKRRWYASNREAINESARRYRQLNPEKTREQARESFKRNYKKNPEAARERLRRRKALRRSASRKSLMPLTLTGKAERFAIWNDCCAYCGAAERLTVDHVLPIKLGGLDEPSNIVPACQRCNCSKHAAPVEDWYRRQSFFTETRWQRILRHCPHIATGQLPLAIPA